MVHWSLQNAHCLREKIEMSWLAEAVQKSKICIVNVGGAAGNVSNLLFALRYISSLERPGIAYTCRLNRFKLIKF